MAVDWHGDEILKRVQDQMGKRLDLAAQSWVIHAKREMGKKINRNIKTRTGKRRAGPNPSKPGTYPAQAEGFLRGRIEREVFPRQFKAVVGTNVIYGKFLELAKNAKSKRPWMKLTNDAMRSKIKAILGKEIK